MGLDFTVFFTLFFGRVFYIVVVMILVFNLLIRVRFVFFEIRIWFVY